MKQTIKNLSLGEIEELSRNGGRVVQVIAHDTTRRARKCGEYTLDEIVECYLCLVEEREEKANEREINQKIDLCKDLGIDEREVRETNEVNVIRLATEPNQNGHFYSAVIYLDRKVIKTGLDLFTGSRSVLKGRKIGEIVALLVEKCGYTEEKVYF